MEYNECKTCGAKDGRCGFTIDGECENCQRTRMTEQVYINADLNRTQEELRKTMEILPL